MDYHNARQCTLTAIESLSFRKIPYSLLLLQGRRDPTSAIDLRGDPLCMPQARLPIAKSPLST
jgi:hypothetical protein